ncbi:UNVERIFIED_CONTAM: Brefeldin A-inhibited guanine nucleotide-exchange protein 2 [Sesamum angustifolium]|uniref:Brefeldin A-inhibited guanine nucleotide-exchange protein 2 n=1 Tax=Sesamum angustifolium TaxID=2727405 RepID=A0AAW2N916_9LAMI
MAMDEPTEASYTHPDASEVSDISKIEQRRAYKLELQILPLKVMHAYVDSFDFEDMEFDDAIRKLLEGFRLPAYVLAYSVIMLNTDAHNPMVKNKMSAEDFIRNNQGIDDGKDLPEEYMRSLFERITKNEIKMKEDNFSIQLKQSVNSNRVLGLDIILNIVIRKPGGDNMETGDDLMKHMQEQFKEKARKSESIYYPATDVVILRFMIEACWAPMLAAFSLLLDQSDDEVIIALCLEGFRNAVHATATMSMKTHRDAFVTSLAKFTSLHSPADIRQKSIDAIKVGAPPDAAFPVISQNELDKSKQAKSNVLPVLRKKGPSKFSECSFSCEERLI